VPTPTPTAPAPAVADLAVSLDRVFAWMRRHRPPSPYSMTALTTLARLRDDGPARVSDLARLEGVTQPAMTGLVNRLEGDGMVRRESDPTDARASLVELTGTGQTWIGERRAERARVLAAELERLPAAHLSALLAAGPALERLAGGHDPT
jgi:DNA-binding MarR family transcriptional regulator